MIKRLTTPEQREKLKKLKKFKGKSISDLNEKDKDELLEILAKKVGIL